MIKNPTLFALLTLFILSLTAAAPTPSPQPGTVRAIKCLHAPSGDYLAVIHDGQNGPYARFKAFRHHRSRRVDRFVRCANKKALYAKTDAFFKYALGHCYHASCSIADDGTCTCTDNFKDCIDGVYQNSVLACNKPTPSPTPSATPSASPSPQPGVVRLIKCADRLSDRFFAVAHDGQNGVYARFKALEADEVAVDSFVRCGNMAANYPSLEAFFGHALGYCYHASCNINGETCTCSDSYPICEDSQLNQALATCS